MLGIDVGTSEDGAFWLSFLRGLVARGLSGVELVTSDVAIGLDLDQVIGLKPGHHQGALVSANDTR